MDTASVTAPVPPPPPKPRLLEEGEADRLLDQFLRATPVLTQPQRRQLVFYVQTLRSELDRMDDELQEAYVMWEFGQSNLTQCICGHQLSTGHGHVHQRRDGMVTRCGGPAICGECKAEQLSHDLAALDR